MPGSPQTHPAMPDRMFHITSRSAWNHAVTVGDYQPDSLAQEGFIHCSWLDQVVGTAHRYFEGQTDLVLLCIQTHAVNPDIRCEAGHDAMLFPHIYGPLNLDAVELVVPFDPTAMAPPCI